MTEVNPTPQTAHYNRLVYASAETVGVRNDEIRAEMDDPSLHQTERAQRETARDGAKSLAVSAGWEMGSYLGGGLGFAAGAAGPFLALYHLGSKLVQANEQGDALANARARDAMHLAVLNLGSAKLPEGFVQQRAGMLGGSARGADRILTHLHASGKHAELRVMTERFIDRGMQAAEARGIVDARTLEVARRDPAFEADYRNNPAFRMGVDAALYQRAQLAVRAP